MRGRAVRELLEVRVVVVARDPVSRQCRLTGRTGSVVDGDAEKKKGRVQEAHV